MRIVFLAPWGERLGGAETMLQGILEGHAGPHELEPVFLQDGPWPRELRAAGLRVEVIEAGRLRDAPRFAVTVRRLARLLRERRPEVLVNWAAKTQLYGAPAAILAGMPGRVVWWQHSIPEGMWLDRVATLLPAAAVGATSQAMARGQERLRPRRATIVVAAGAPLPAPGEPAPLELPAGVPVVGIVGRLQPWKGQDRLLRAHALLRARGARLHTVVVGGDSYGLSPEYAASLPRLVSELGLEGEVTFTGEVPDAGPYVERFDVLVNASDPEPFGIVVLEGMARAKPVLAVGAGGPAEMIEDGRTGVLASSGSPDALADALGPLLDSAERREQLGSAARERFLDEYTTAAMRERMFAALERIAAGERG